jgi:hypothetical protein
MTVSWWRRLLFSLASWMAAAILSGSLFVLTDEIGVHSSESVTLLQIGAGFAFFVAMVFLVSLPGWLLAIPIVLAVRNIAGWRFWMYFALGTFIGPIWILSMGLYFSLVSPHHAGFAPGPSDLYYRAVAVSSLTTLIYLLLLRRAQPAAAGKGAAAEDESQNFHF